MSSKTLEIVSNSVAETLGFGKILSGVLSRGDVICLTGDLGAGKTVLTKGVALGLGLPDADIVTSPTFVLLNIYQTRIPIMHFDLYRIDGPELANLGFHDLRPTGVTIVEWGEKAREILDDCVEIIISAAGKDRRKIQARSNGPRSAQILGELAGKKIRL